MFRKPTKEEIEHTFPAASRGWESQRLETEGWVTTVEGEVPKDLLGTYIRNGPGLNDVFGVPLKHPIDGDGMVVALTFFEGKVHMKNKFVKTFSHVEEQKAGRMLYNGNMGSRVPPPGPANPRVMRDPAHTNAFYWGGKILACHEYALPSSLDPRTLETIGSDTLDGALNKIGAFSAHFRLDAAQDLLVGIGFKPGNPLRKPKLAVFEFDREWKAVQETHLSIPGLNYAHDFLLTPSWYIFHMTPFVDVSEKAMREILSGKKAPGEMMGYNPDLPSRMVLVQRYVKQGEERQVLQFETEPCHIYHFQNAVEVDDDTITFGATCLPPGFNMDWQYKVFLSNSADAPGQYHNYCIKISQNKCTRTLSPKVAGYSNEFPTSNPYRNCVRLNDSTVLPPRYVYLMAGARGVTIPFTEIVKYDEKGNRDDAWIADGLVGEPVFAPRLGKQSAFYGEDDDGWIITQLYRPGKHQVEFVVLDAQNLSQGPVCRIKPGMHIPFSFHGTFTPHVFNVPPPKL